MCQIKKEVKQILRHGTYDKGKRKMKEKPYYEQQNNKNNRRLRGKLQELPSYCRQYFISIEATTESRTRTAYIYDLISYFEYLQKEIPICKDVPLPEITLTMLEQITPQQIEEYLSYLRYYEKNGREYTNGQRGLKRKLASLRSFYAYYYRNDLIKSNPAVKVLMPKIHTKPIVRLEQDEIYWLLKEVESGNNLTERQKKFHEKTKERDKAVMMLLLGTGIRVSECVGINLDDVDFKYMGVRVHRKGGSEAIVYFNKEVKNALYKYYEQRINMIPNEGSAEAFFLSITGNRLSVRSIESLVKKYTEKVTKLKKITPHKLRSTFGSALYRKSGDIFLVADALGNTVGVAQKHYVEMDDSRKKSVPSYIKLNTLK